MNSLDIQVPPSTWLPSSDPVITSTLKSVAQAFPEFLSPSPPPLLSSLWNHLICHPALYHSVTHSLISNLYLMCKEAPVKTWKKRGARLLWAWVGFLHVAHGYTSPWACPVSHRRREHSCLKNHVSPTSSPGRFVPRLPQKEKPTDRKPL